VRPFWEHAPPLSHCARFWAVSRQPGLLGTGAIPLFGAFGGGISFFLVVSSEVLRVLAPPQPLSLTVPPSIRTPSFREFHCRQLIFSGGTASESHRSGPISLFWRWPHFGELLPFSPTWGPPYVGRECDSPTFFFPIRGGGTIGGLPGSFCSRRGADFVQFSLTHWGP